MSSDVEEQTIKFKLLHGECTKFVLATPDSVPKVGGTPAFVLPEIPPGTPVPDSEQLCVCGFPRGHHSRSVQDASSAKWTFKNNVTYVSPGADDKPLGQIGNVRYARFAPNLSKKVLEKLLFKTWRLEKPLCVISIVGEEPESLCKELANIACLEGIWLLKDGSIREDSKFFDKGWEELKDKHVKTKVIGSAYFNKFKNPLLRAPFLANSNNSQSPDASTSAGQEAAETPQNIRPDQAAASFDVEPNHLHLLALYDGTNWTAPGLDFKFRSRLEELLLDHIASSEKETADRPMIYVVVVGGSIDFGTVDYLTQSLEKGYFVVAVGWDPMGENEGLVGFLIDLKKDLDIQKYCKDKPQLRDRLIQFKSDYKMNASRWNLNIIICEKSFRRIVNWIIEKIVDSASVSQLERLVGESNLSKAETLTTHPGDYYGIPPEYAEEYEDDFQDNEPIDVLQHVLFRAIKNKEVSLMRWFLDKNLIRKYLTWWHLEKLYCRCQLDHMLVPLPDLYSRKENNPLRMWARWLNAALKDGANIAGGRTGGLCSTLDNLSAKNPLSSTQLLNHASSQDNARLNPNQTQIEKTNTEQKQTDNTKPKENTDAKAGEGTASTAEKSSNGIVPADEQSPLTSVHSSNDVAPDGKPTASTAGKSSNVLLENKPRNFSNNKNDSQVKTVTSNTSGQNSNGVASDGKGTASIAVESFNDNSPDEEESPLTCCWWCNSTAVQSSDELTFEWTGTHLFLLCILMNRRKLALVFWQKEKNSLGLALLASFLLKRLSNETPYEKIKESLMKKSKFFGQLSLELLRVAHSKYSENFVGLLLCAPQPLLGGVTCMELAYLSEANQVLSCVASQRILQSVWKGYISDTKFQYFLAWITLGIFSFTLSFRNCEIIYFPDSNAKKYKSILPLPQSSKHCLDKYFQVKNKQWGKDCGTGYDYPEPSYSYWWKMLAFHTAPVTIFYYSLVSYFVFLILFSCFLLGLSTPQNTESPLKNKSTPGYLLSTPGYTPANINQSIGIIPETTGNTNLSDSIPESTTNTNISDSTGNTNRKILFWTIWIWVFSFLADELIQLFSHLNCGTKRMLTIHFLKNKWNILDMISITTFFVGAILFVFRNSEQISRIMFVASLVLFYVRLVTLFSHFEWLSFGLKIEMIVRVIKDLIGMAIIIAVVVVAAGIAFLALIERDRTEDTFISFVNILGRGWWPMFGEFFTSDTLKRLENCSNNSSSHKSTICNMYWRIGAAFVLQAVFVLFTNLLLFNVIIALFNYTIDQTKNDMEEALIRVRYQVYKEYFEKPFLPPPLILILYIICLFQWLWKITKSCRKSGCTTNCDRLAEHSRFCGVMIEEKDIMDLEEYINKEIVNLKNGILVKELEGFTKNREGFTKKEEEIVKLREGFVKELEEFGKKREGFVKEREEFVNVREGIMKLREEFLKEREEFMKERAKSN